MDIVILIVCTCLIISRLVKMLGYYDPNQSVKKDNIIIDLINQKTPSKDIEAKVISATELELQPELRAVIKDIKTQDADFDIDKFILGAKKAYTMLVNAMASGDLETLSYLLDEDLFASTRSKIQQEKDTEFRRTAEVKDISSMKISTAALYGDRAVLSVDVTSSIISQTKDLNGNLISGSDQPSTKSEKIAFSRYLAQEKIWKITKIQ